MERISIKPLVECKWGQYAPFYNNLKLAGKYHLVGCNALAIAQIMYYWGVQRGYHRGCKATPKYTTATKKMVIDALPPITVFDYVNMTATKPTTTKGKAAVAVMCAYIAKAIRSDFGTAETSATRTLLETVMQSTLRLGNCKHIYKSTTADFEQQIYDNIANGRPVILTSTSSGGHTFVVDGYDAETKKYHINWGWSGQYDGWYSLNGLNVNGKKYNGSLMAIVNIQPLYQLGDANDDGVISVSDVVTVVNDVNKGVSAKATDINSDGKTTIEDAEIIVEHLVKGDVL